MIRKDVGRFANFILSTFGGQNTNLCPHTVGEKPFIDVFFFFIPSKPKCLALAIGYEVVQHNFSTVATSL